MGGKSQLFAVIIEYNALIHYGKGNTVQDLLHFHIVHLHIAKKQNQTAPNRQHRQIFPNLDVVVINYAADNATQYIVLHRIGGCAGCQIAFSGNVNDKNQS